MARRLRLRLHLHTVASQAGRGAESVVEIATTSALGQATEPLRLSRVADVSSEHTEIPYSENLRLDIDSTGVRVRTQFKVEVPGWCNPPARIDGKFRIEKDGLALVTDWVSGPTPSTAVPVLSS